MPFLTSSGNISHLSHHVALSASRQPRRKEQEDPNQGLSSNLAREPLPLRVLIRKKYTGAESRGHAFVRVPWLAPLGSTLGNAVRLSFISVSRRIPRVRRLVVGESTARFTQGAPDSEGQEHKDIVQSLQRKLLMLGLLLPRPGIPTGQEIF